MAFGKAMLFILFCYFFFTFRLIYVINVNKIFVCYFGLEENTFMVRFIYNFLHGLFKIATCFQILTISKLQEKMLCLFSKRVLKKQTFTIKQECFPRIASVSNE